MFSLPLKWKKANCSPSLLEKGYTMLEKLQTSLIAFNLQEILIENNLISSNQSDFKSGDFFIINQLFL